MTNEEKTTKVVYTAVTARKLLKLGFTIVDIKPDKNDPEHKQTVFVFRNDAGLVDALKKFANTKYE